jgi:formylglycine-generating enzyme required for sulfatase activity
LDKEKKMKKVAVLAVVVCMLLAANFVSADIIRGINIDFVNIGYAGNAADTLSTARPTNCGAVAYNYKIGKFEVTNAQWNTFVSLAGAPTGTDGTYTTGSYYTGNLQPVGATSWYESLQFCNYLTSGNKYAGAYKFSSAGTFLGIDRAAALATYGTVYVLPTNDEWYKAAYFKADASGYSKFANGTDTAPVAKGTDTNWGYSLSTPWNVGSGTMEQNDTYDMMGNMWEMTESLWNTTNYRSARGGFWSTADWLPSYLSSEFQAYQDVNREITSVGFRVAVIPEPATMIILALGGLALLRKK